MKDTITKKVLAEKVCYEMGIPVSMALDIIDSLFKNIIQSTVDEDVVKIANFGSFNTKEKKERIGRDLNTLEDVVIPARKVVSFQPSNHLKRVVNE